MQGTLVATINAKESEIAVVVFDSRTVRSPLRVISRQGGFAEALANESASFVLRADAQADLPVTVHGVPGLYEYAPVP